MEAYASLPGPGTSDVNPLVESIYRIVGEGGAAPPPQKDDRTEKLEQSVAKVAAELDEMKRVLNDVHALSDAQTRLLTLTHHRQEESRKTLEEKLESQSSDVKALLKR
ncbi:hypothetical protein H4R21_002199, partial [Coemansia helicoidea]